MSNPQPSRQRGAAADPRHGKARGEVIKGGIGARPLLQVAFVLLVLLGVVAAFFLVAVLISDDLGQDSLLRYAAYGVLIGLALLAVFLFIRRRRGRQSLDEALRSRRAE